MRSHVLDASALLALFDGRPGANKVAELLKSAVVRDRVLLMSVVNWGEVYYSIWRARGAEAANEKLREISQLPIEIVDVDQDTARLAASFKAECKLPYADAFAAALARQKKASVVTADADFALLGDRIGVVWLAKRDPK